MLPVDGVVEVLAFRSQVCNRNQQQIYAHAQVSKGQVAHQELGDSHFEAGAEKDDDDGEVADNSGDHDTPYRDSEPHVAHHVLTGIEGIWFGRALDIDLDPTYLSTDDLCAMFALT